MKKAPVRLKPLRFSVHQAIYELNRSFEACIENLHRVAMFRFFNADHLRTYLLMLKEVRALTNDELAGAVSDRESENALYYERERLRCLERLEKESMANAPHTAGKAIARPKRKPRRSKNEEKGKVRP